MERRSSRYAAWRFRAGRDTVVVRDGDRRAVALDVDLCYQSRTKEETVVSLLQKAAISSPTPSWTTYKTETWVRTGTATRRMEFGAARRIEAPLGSDGIAAMGLHLYRRLDENGWPAYSVDASLGQYQRRGGAPRCIQGLHALSEVAEFCGQAVWQTAAQRGLGFAVARLRADTRTVRIAEHGGGPMADACLLHAVAATGTDSLLPLVAGVAARLRGWIQSDGALLSEGALRSTTDLDFLPGVALLALTKYALRSGDDLGIDWRTVRAWHRRRFEILHPWGTALWHSLVWPAVFQFTKDDADAEFALEIADWMSAQQLRSDGTFLTDLHTTGQSFHTACSARGIAAAWGLALDIGDRARADQYQEVWQKAMTFMNRLVIRPEDTFWRPTPR